jgi:hypothetical protein
MTAAKSARTDVGAFRTKWRSQNFRLKYPAMGPLELTEEQEAELRRLLGVYKRETERCRKAKACLAGCVISGAELETALLMMVNAFPDEATATGKVPRRNKAVKPLLQWNLAELRQVARAAGWLPSALEYGKDDWNAKIAEIGDYAELVRELRNFAHPARYLEDHYRKRITQKHLEYVIEIINDVADWLYARIARSLME